MNLAGNAIKFTDEGNITIEANLKSQDNKNAIIEITITDTGIGIKEDQLDKIFESFSQATSDTYRKYGGTGLGLTISRQLVGLMGGNLSVKSKPGEGTSFFFDIALPIGDATKLQDSASSKTSFPKLKNTRVLLFEDNLFNQVVAKQILNATIEGVQLDIAENGLVGLEKLKQNDYDIVLMDIQMPELNGYETSQKIRNEFTGAKKNIPILAMTANAIKEEIEKCMEYGMDDHITKPFEPSDLLSKMSKLLQKNN
jgi:CheY-like chemotaxis protein